MCSLCQTMEAKHNPSIYRHPCVILIGNCRYVEVVLCFASAVRQCWYTSLNAEMFHFLLDAVFWVSCNFFALAQVSSDTMVTVVHVYELSQLYFKPWHTSCWLTIKNSQIMSCKLLHKCIYSEIIGYESKILTTFYQVCVQGHLLGCPKVVGRSLILPAFFLTPRV